MLKVFAGVGVSRVMLEKFLDCKVEAASDAQVGILRQIVQQIKNGKMKVEQVFGSAKGAVDNLNATYNT